MSNFRSTKGASKQRRDMINNEILKLRDLLPLPESARQRLSQLQIMSLTNVYIRKCNYFGKIFQHGNSTFSQGEIPFEFAQSLTGFVMVATREGKLLYISENVTEYLGHSMVDMMTQGDNLYDIIDKRDHATVQSHLLSASVSEESQEGGAAPDERTIFCRMNVARSFRRQAGFGEHKMMHVTGHYIQPTVRDQFGNQPVFMAVCSPLITPDVKETVAQNNTMIFQTVHGLDMKYIEVAPNGEHHLGFTEAEMFGKSWYEMLHPNDIHEAKEKHVQLIKSSHEMGCMLTVRLQSKLGGWVWVNMVMHIRQPFVCDNGDPAIVCINYVIKESEAELFKLQSQLYSSHIAPSPEFMGPPAGSSPPHTITQVPMERERYTVTGTYLALPETSQDRISYRGECVQDTSTSSEDVRTVVGGSGDHFLQLQTSIGSSPESDSDFSDPGERHTSRQPSHEAVINLLKRKFSDPAKQCKPAKVPKINHSGHDGSFNGSSESISYRASVLAGTPNLDDFVGSVYSSGDLQVVRAVQDTPVYSQLAHLKKELEVQPMAAPQVRDCSLPMSPLTPQSFTSEYNISEQTILPDSTQLKIETDMAIVPPSVLTPEPSPVGSPENSYAASPDYHCTPSPPYQGAVDQCLPSEILSRLEDNSFYYETDQEKKIQKIAPKPVLELAKQDLLPDLDLGVLEGFFSTVEVKDGMRRPSNKLRLVQRQLQQPTNAVVPVTVLEEEERSRMMLSPAVDMERQPAAPSANPATGEILSQFGDEQYNRLVASVTNTIFDMVSNTEPNLSADFLLVPNIQNPAASPKEDELLDLSTIFADDPILSPSHGDQTLPSHGDLFAELHQLNELASLTPSYGDEELAAVLFNKTL